MTPDHRQLAEYEAWERETAERMKRESKIIHKPRSKALTPMTWEKLDAARGSER